MVPHNRFDGLGPISFKLVPLADTNERRAHDFRPRSAGAQMNWVPSYRRPPSPEEIRFHLWLNERLAVVHSKRDGLWSKVRRFFFGD
jgi:hypothetical protein